MKSETKRMIRIIGVVLFILYMFVLTYLLFFSERYGRTEPHEYRYNLVPLQEIKRFWIYRESIGWMVVMTNLVGNVLAFLPFGAILPVLSIRCRGFFRITLFSFEFSLLVECIQLISKVGSFDVDDLILNTLGGAIGYLLFAVTNRIRRKIYG